ncbi:MAG: cobalamin B12-binding domain-containing protein [bacterium]
MKSKKLIMGACLGECIHVAGTMNFLKLAEQFGYSTIFLGPSISVKRFINALLKYKPDIAAVSYRLTPQTAYQILNELKQELSNHEISNIRFVFGGTPPVAKIAEDTDIFEKVFSGLESLETVIEYLKQEPSKGSLSNDKKFPQTLVERIMQNQPFPLLRHHLGLETVQKTVDNAREIALSEELDILSIAPDQNAQEYFFRPQEMPDKGHGAGGVPVRSPSDMRAIYIATRCGNYPLLRCYAGTRDLIKWAEMSAETINIAWGAVPLFWYSELDKRSDRPLFDAIIENQSTMRWYAEHGRPLEVNDSHQWSLRDAHDAIAVATAYLAAYNAKAMGVQHYVSQYMLNTPPNMTPKMDLAKMLAKIEMIENLHDEKFTSFRQIRTGLRSLSCNPERAKGQLLASVTIGMSLKPHIVHVVGYCEADHAATAKEIIESCSMVKGAINLAKDDIPNIEHDPSIRKRKNQLIKEANLIIDAIKHLGNDDNDPLIDPIVLVKAVKIGILDAPHLQGSGVAMGKVVTMPVNGAYMAIDPKTGKTLSEQKRLYHIFNG